MTDYPHSNQQDAQQPEGLIERRTGGEDRRGNRRQGKLDRRRNRCGACRFYGEHLAESEPTSPIPPSQAMCQQHQQEVKAIDFGCVLFEGI